MVLSVLVGNGAQLIAMVGVTLRKHPYYSNPALLILNFSVRSSRILVSFEPWRIGNRHDGFLDILWSVRSFSFSTLLSMNLDGKSLSVGGYTSSRVYASLGGTDRRKSAFFTATILPA